MKWLLPRSIFGRLVVVLLGGLIIAQLAAAYINLAERDRLLYRAGGMQLAQRIADIAHLLDSVAPSERRSTRSSVLMIVIAPSRAQTDR